MLTRAQNALYWREWSAVKRVLMPGRSTWTKHEESERRHALHIQALGDDKSHVDFNNEDFDHVLGALRAISRPDDLNAQLHALNGQRARLLHGIRKLADEASPYAREYINGIVERMNAEGKLGSSILEDLHPRELVKVMVALKKHERRGVVHEPCLHVETSGNPF
jgi:hypothetical protein